MPSGSDDPRVAVIVVNYRTPDLTLRCLAALGRERALCPSLRVVVVDGGSNDGSAEKLEKVLKQPEYLPWASLMPLLDQRWLRLGQQSGNADAGARGSRQPPNFIMSSIPIPKICPGAIAEVWSGADSDGPAMRRSGKPACLRRTASQRLRRSVSLIRP